VAARPLAIALWFLVVAGGGARGLVAQTTERVSVDSAGVEGDGSCKWSSLSADGRLVVYDSASTNLVAGDLNGAIDVFLLDRTTGTTTRLSVDANGLEGDADSDYPALSSDGLVAAFSSSATNLVAGDTNGQDDIFVRDLVTGTLERVSVDAAGMQGDKQAARPRLSADGRFVTFYSNSTHLVPGDGNKVSDVFVVDRALGTIERISVDSAGGESDGGSFTTSISGDGRYVAFVSDATNLVAGDTNGLRDIFVRDRSLGTTVRVSVSSAGAEALHGRCDSASMAEDGRYVAFYSLADTLVAGDTNRKGDLFLHDLQTATTELVSVNLNGAVGNDDSFHPAVSADGRYVAFESEASDLVAGDLNGAFDVFMRDRQLATTTRVSVDSAGAEGNGDSHFHASISAEGLHVSFVSDATNLVAADGNGVSDIFVHHLCPPASWTTYGSGWAGTLAIPALVPQADPVLGTTLLVDLDDSTGVGTLAIVLVGDASTLLPTNKGGALLVIPFVSLVVVVPAGGVTLDADLPDDEALCGLALYAQALELDPGATKGLSFTAGLELLLGR
jgi:Tol biopolymer transport system component